MMGEMLRKVADHAGVELRAPGEKWELTAEHRITQFCSNAA
jgi:hypothetical protein